MNESQSAVSFLVVSCPHAHGIARMSEMNTKAKFADIELAYNFVSSAAPSTNSAFLCRETGMCHWHSKYDDLEEPLPEDVWDRTKYVEIPHKNDLDLGQRLVFRFVGRVLPDDVGEVTGIFRRRGAYRHFKSLLERRGKLDEWFEFQNNSERDALRQWCADNGVALED